MFVGLPLLLYFGFLFWSSHRPQPAGIKREIFPGITYFREVKRTAPALVAHIVTIPLDSPKVSLFVTPADAPEAEKPLKARTTSQFLTDFKVQIAINADFFYPWYDQNILQYRPKQEDFQDLLSLPDKIWNYYPHPGDPVTTQGMGASKGQAYNDTHERIASYPTLYFTKDNRPSLSKPIGRVYNALSGGSLLLQNGIRPVVTDKPFYNERHPRTAIGLDKTRKWLILVVIDGRQPNFSEGATITELTDILEEHGAYIALNLDGGGSTALVMEGQSGEPIVLNTPIDHRLPGRQRPVANHLGIFVEK